MAPRPFGEVSCPYVFGQTLGPGLGCEGYTSKLKRRPYKHASHTHCPSVHAGWYLFVQQCDCANDTKLTSGTCVVLCMLTSLITQSVTGSLWEKELREEYQVRPSPTDRPPSEFVFLVGRACIFNFFAMGIGIIRLVLCCCINNEGPLRAGDCNKMSALLRCLYCGLIPAADGML